MIKLETIKDDEQLMMLVESGLVSIERHATADGYEYWIITDHAEAILYNPLHCVVTEQTIYHRFHPVTRYVRMLIALYFNIHESKIMYPEAGPDATVEAQNDVLWPLDASSLAGGVLLVIVTLAGLWALYG